MGMTVRSFTEEGWEDDLLALLASRAPGSVLPRPGSLWLSRSTGRRASVLWASQGRVCLSYDETRSNARKVHRLQDFEHLYTEAK